jgi:hypothetical protein
MPGRASVSMTCVNFATVDIHKDDPRYRAPIERDARVLARKLPPQNEIILLGSIATGKYVNVLVTSFGDRLRFPADSVGRGDMSRGGLLLRCAVNRRIATICHIQIRIRRRIRASLPFCLSRYLCDQFAGLPGLIQT